MMNSDIRESSWFERFLEQEDGAATIDCAVMVAVIGALASAVVAAMARTLIALLAN